ncbi:MAG TPA: twin-arginine translocase subunit TatC [Candidatus Competibacteraceae bacterium]|nr:twin-arginine translocase subunit TatC [Candidatus Competibacteraceae bacterium]
MSDEHIDQEQSFISHLLELRTRILRAILGVLAVFLVLAPFANPLFELLSQPLLANMPMTSIRPISPFLTPLKFTLVLALFVAIPWVLYQIWAFVAPGLYRSERRLVLPLLVSSTLLFYVGMAFAQFVVLRAFFHFIAGTAPEGVMVMPDIDETLSFILTIYFAFGVAFEVPVAVIVLVLMGVTTPAALRDKRPYIIVGAFVAGAILTPPDVISQVLLALPMWLLFELGVVFAAIMLRRRGEVLAEHGGPEPEALLDQLHHEGAQPPGEPPRPR